MMTDERPNVEAPAHCAICGRDLVYIGSPSSRWFHVLASRPRLAPTDADAGWKITHDPEPSMGRFDDCHACALTLRDRRAVKVNDDGTITESELRALDGDR